MTSLKTSIKTITYLSDIGCLEIQGASLLSDVNMPNMDGYRLTQRIRQLGLTLPVIGVTANALAEEKQRCLESGMDSCLSKPVTLDVIKQTLTLYAERVRKSRDS
nr:response regulator [Escherichia coli]